MKVYVPTWNSERTLTACLLSIHRTIPSPNVTIVDRNSTDSTVNIAARFNANVHQANLNLGQARSWMCRQFHDDWFAMIDSDIILRSGWFGHILTERDYWLECDPHVGAVQSNDTEYPLEPDTPWAVQYNHYIQWRRQALTFPIKNPVRLDTNALLVRPDAVQGFHSNANAYEDYQLGQHLYQRGFSAYAVDVPVDHDMGLTEEGWMVRCRCAGAAARQTGYTSRRKLLAGLVVRSLQAPWGVKRFTANTYWQLLHGYRHVLEYGDLKWS